jgi:poly(3-hydroxybutyrate) depolymerase
MATREAERSWFPLVSSLEGQNGKCAHSRAEERIMSIGTIILIILIIALLGGFSGVGGGPFYGTGYSGGGGLGLIIVILLILLLLGKI